MASQTYAVIGAGAVGGFYGAKLQKAGFQVNFLLNRDYAWVRDHGFKIRSPEGDFELPQVRAYASVDQMSPCDVILVALKTTHNHLLSKLLPPLLKPDSKIVLLQNGLGNEAAIAQILAVQGYTTQLIVGGLCFLCSNKREAGVIEHLDYGLINLGAYGPGDRPMGITSALNQLAQDLQQAEIEVKTWENLLLQRWKKLIWNIPFNGLSVVLDAQTNELMADLEIVALVQTLMREVQQAAAANQCDIPDDFLTHMLDLTVKMQPYRTSMKLDCDANREMEVDMMFANPLKAAHQAQVETPHLSMLYQQLQFMNGRIKKSQTRN